MAYRQYTHCVDIHDYKGDPRDNPAAAVAIAAIIVALVGILSGIGAVIGVIALIVAVVNGYWAWQQFCDYLLGGKLICLGYDQCVIGRVVQLEPVGYHKSGLETIDNDYAVDLLLAPHLPVPDEGFADAAAEANDIRQNDHLQGFFIDEQAASRDAGMPYEVLTTDPPLPPKPQPYLHCEFEGSRVHDVCEAASNATGVPSAICDIPIIGTIICAIATLIAAPFVLAAVLTAWFGAHDGDPADAAKDPRSGSLGVGDLVLITGDWVYDAGHNHGENRGWNEIHPAKSVQFIPPQQDPAKWTAPWFAASAPWIEGNTQAAYDDFKRFLDAWCHGTRLAADPTVQDNQRKRENHWYFHPDIDGCDPPPPPIR